MSTRQAIATSRSDVFGVLRWLLVIGVSFALLASLMTWVAGFLPLGASGSGGASSAAAAVDFRLDSLDGQRLGPPDYRGKVVVIDFWATWCGPCRLQAKYLEKLHQEFPAEEVQFLAINVGEPAEMVRDFVAKTPFPYPVLLDPADELSRRFQIAGLPTVMVLDRQGVIVFQEPGVTDDARLREVLVQAGAG